MLNGSDSGVGPSDNGRAGAYRRSSKAPAPRANAGRRVRGVVRFAAACGGLLFISACTGTNRNLEASRDWTAWRAEGGREGATSRFEGATKVLPNGSGTDPAAKTDGPPQPVVLRLGLSDCLELAASKSFESVVMAIEEELSDARVQSARAFDDLRFTGSLDFNQTEQALETRLTGDTRTREDQTTTRASFGVLKPLQTGTTIGFSHSLNQTETNSPFNTFDWSSGMSLTVKQNLLDGFGLTANRGGLDIALGEQVAADFSRQRKRGEMSLKVAQAYWQLVMAREKVRILGDQRDSARADLRRIRDRRAQGEELRLDELRAASAVAGHEEALVGAELEAVQASDALIGSINPEILYGYAIIPGWQLVIEPKEVSVAPDAPVPSIHDSVTIALEARPDLKAAIKRAENAGIRVRQREQGLLPKLEAEGSAALWGFGGDYADTLSDIMEAKNRRLGVKLAFEMPLGNNADMGAMRIARAEQEQALWSVREAEVRVIREVIDAVRKLESSIRGRREAERTLALAREEYAAVQQSQAGGIASSFEVRQAQVRVTMKELDVSKAKIGVELARLAVLSASGQ